jgi:hypothetical protein
MELFPGNYIHITCRGTAESRLKSGAYNPNAERLHTQEEIFTQRVPYMTRNQRRRGINSILRGKSKFNTRSTKNSRNIWLAGLRKSLTHDEILNKTRKL